MRNVFWQHYVRVSSLSVNPTVLRNNHPLLNFACSTFAESPNRELIPGLATASLVRGVNLVFVTLQQKVLTNV